MKKSINAWTFHNEYTFRDCLAAARDAGFDAIEFNLDADGKSAHSFYLTTTDEEILAVRALCTEYGITPVSVSSSMHGGLWSRTEPECVEKAKKIITQQLNIARLLGADTILVVPGGMRDGMILSESRKNSIANLKAVEPIIRASGVKVGLENVWNGFFLSPYDMMSFLDELDPELFGLYYDLGNMVAFSDTVNWTDIVAPRTLKIHVKDYKRTGGINRGGVFCQLLEGDVNFEVAMQQLKAAGFDGYLTAEVFKDDDAMSWQDYFASISAAEEKIIEFYNK
jgi:hexulose-6-phosphate isomerase